MRFSLGFDNGGEDFDSSFSRRPHHLQSHSSPTPSPSSASRAVAQFGHRLRPPSPPSPSTSSPFHPPPSATVSSFDAVSPTAVAGVPSCPLPSTSSPPPAVRLKLRPVIGQLRFPNLVKLIGYCCEDDHRLLVYEFMFRGSLENHLFRKTTVPLSWSTRMMIALGAAKGLAFLHNAERPVIYRDFKTSNILLDSDYTAKLSDFGLAKAGPQGDETHVSTRVMGTYGYAAPEYVMTGHLTARSDVYSFGVVLLELLTGRKSVDKTRPSKEQNLVDWARPKLNDKRKMLQIIDPRLENQYSVRAAQKACSLAYYCLSQNPKARPLMSDVVETLEPLQCSGIANEASSSSLSGVGIPFGVGRVPEFQLHHRFAGNLGTAAGCRSPNPNCSPGGPAPCRVR